MKNLKHTLTALLTAVSMTTTVHAAEWQIDPVHSTIGFSATHLMVSTVHGDFENYTAKINFDEAKPEALTAEVTIETSSINTRSQQRDDHLRNADFFDAANFPTMTFKSKKVKVLGQGKMEVVGDLTIRGITKEVTLTGEAFQKIQKTPWGKTVTAAHAETTINRKDFGLLWNKALETGGVVVSDEIKIEIDLELIKG